MMIVLSFLLCLVLSFGGRAPTRSCAFPFSYVLHSIFRVEIIIDCTFPFCYASGFD